MHPLHPNSPLVSHPNSPQVNRIQSVLQLPVLCQQVEEVVVTVDTTSTFPDIDEGLPLVTLQAPANRPADVLHPYKMILLLSTLFMVPGEVMCPKMGYSNSTRKQPSPD